MEADHALGADQEDLHLVEEGSQEVDQGHVGEQDLVADVVVALVPVVTVEVEVVADGEGDRTVAADPKIPLLPSAIKSCMTVRNCIFSCC